MAWRLRGSCFLYSFEMYKKDDFIAISTTNMLLLLYWLFTGSAHMASVCYRHILYTFIPIAANLTRAFLSPTTIKINAIAEVYFAYQLSQTENQLPPIFFNFGKWIPYSRYYKTHLYKILRLFGATCIQVFDDFLIFKPWKLLLGATSIQVRLIFKSVL